MGTLSWILRLAAGILGLVGLIAVALAMRESIPALLETKEVSGPSLVIAWSQLLAVGLTPPSLLLLAIRPRLWPLAALAPVWAVIATMLVYPRSLDFLF